MEKSRCTTSISRNKALKNIGHTVKYPYALSNILVIFETDCCFLEICVL
nr:MAG TPA: hypothetical protein [Caudoviricetes sp.]